MNNTKKKLNPNARKWVRALRSGKYKQGKSYLVRIEKGGMKHCCLGVACEIYRAAGKRLRRHEVNKLIQFGVDGDIAYLPMPVQKWLGLTTNDGSHVNRRKCSRTLVSMNDNGRNFEQIAKVIESQPMGLFA